jgi:hypothetical protein
LLIFRIFSHSFSLTGITDSLPIRTSGICWSDASALISLSVTGRASFSAGATSTA